MSTATALPDQPSGTPDTSLTAPEPDRTESHSGPQDQPAVTGKLFPSAALWQNGEMGFFPGIV